MAVPTLQEKVAATTAAFAHLLEYAANLGSDPDAPDKIQNTAAPYLYECAVCLMSPDMESLPAEPMWP